MSSEFLLYVLVSLGSSQSFLTSKVLLSTESVRGLFLMFFVCSLV